MQKSEVFPYFLAVLFGLAAGLLEIRIGDLLVTAVFVMIATMVLGYLRPRKAWRWTLLVAVFVPLLRIAAYYLVEERAYRAQVWESVLGFVTGAVGAYAGVLARRGVDELFRSQH